MTDPFTLAILVVALLALGVGVLALRALGAQRARTTELLERHDRLLEAVRALEPSGEATNLPPEFEPLRASQEALLQEAERLRESSDEHGRRLGHHETALETFAGMLEDQHELLEHIDQRTRLIATSGEARAGDLPPRPAPAEGQGEGSNPAQQIAREWMSSEGYSDVSVGVGEGSPAGWRMPVRGLKGLDLRAGWITVHGGAVVEARLDVPTSLFP